MVTDRPKRQNAGNRMSKLLEEQADEDEDDEFYKNTYGGFDEEEEDVDYESEEPEEDIVDSGMFIKPVLKYMKFRLKQVSRLKHAFHFRKFYLPSKQSALCFERALQAQIDYARTP